MRCRNLIGYGSVPLLALLPAGAVELHGGTIDATNAGPDGGATFVISVPAPATDVARLTTAGTSTM